MEKVFLLLGSNLGNRILHLEKARNLIHIRAGQIIASSSIYVSKPWGKLDQPDFLNQCIEIKTSLLPNELLDVLQKTELEIGRERIGKWGPRIIDIDILLYGQQQIQNPDLTIPHSFLHVRRFTLLPLNEIASTVLHPVLNKNIKTLLAECEDFSAVSSHKES